MIGDTQSFLAICESDPGTQRLLNIYFIKLGFRAFIRCDCLELLEAMIAESVVPDIIFFQPRCHLTEAMNCLKTPHYDAYRNLPVVAITTDPGKEHSRKLLKFGVSEVLLKPFRFDDISHIIEKHRFTP